MTNEEHLQWLATAVECLCFDAHDVGLTIKRHISGIPERTLGPNNSEIEVTPSEVRESFIEAITDTLVLLREYHTKDTMTKSE